MFCDLLGQSGPKEGLMCLLSVQDIILGRWVNDLPWMLQNSERMSRQKLWTSKEAFHLQCHENHLAMSGHPNSKQKEEYLTFNAATTTIQCHNNKLQT